MDQNVAICRDRNRIILGVFESAVAAKESWRRAAGKKGIEIRFVYNDEKIIIELKENRRIIGFIEPWLVQDKDADILLD